MTLEPKQIATRAAELLDSKKAEDLLVLDIGHLTAFADCMVIANGRSMAQVKALADVVEEGLTENGINPTRREGYADGRWIVLDYGCVLVHIFHEQEREFYHLERLWMDGTNSVAVPGMR